MSSENTAEPPKVPLLKSVQVLVTGFSEASALAQTRYGWPEAPLNENWKLPLPSRAGLLTVGGTGADRVSTALLLMT